MKNYLAAIYLVLVFILGFYVKSNHGVESKDCSCVCEDGTICSKIKFIWFSKCQCQENGCPNKYKYNGKFYIIE